MDPQIILASSSVYRRQLLDRLGISYRCCSPDIDETPRPDEPPDALSRRLARQKAESLTETCPNHWIIGSDQVASLNGEILGKPGDFNNAVTQLSRCSANEVLFYTSLALVDSAAGKVQIETDITGVKFRALTPDEIHNYLTVEQPYDCAGSFKVEGLGISLFERVDNSDPTALIGLPLIRLATMLRNWGLNLLGNNPL